MGIIQYRTSSKNVESQQEERRAQGREGDLLRSPQHPARQERRQRLRCLPHQSHFQQHFHSRYRSVRKRDVLSHHWRHEGQGIVRSPLPTPLCSLPSMSARNCSWSALPPSTSSLEAWVVL